MSILQDMCTHVAWGVHVPIAENGPVRQALLRSGGTTNWDSPQGPQTQKEYEDRVWLSALFFGTLYISQITYPGSAMTGALRSVLQV